MYKYGIIETENRMGRAKDIPLTWLFEEDGTLSIFGAGMLPDYRADQERPWQEYAGQVRKVVIDEGLTSVGARTFAGYELLEEVKLPSTMNRIGFQAFAGCGKLEKVDVNKPVAHVYTTNVASASRGVLREDTVYIGMQSFAGTPWITAKFGPMYIHHDVLVEYYGKEQNVEIPRGIREIGTSAFEGSSVKQVKLPATVRIIDGFAFNKTGLTSLELPASVKKVGRYAFAQTEQLESVLIGDPDIELEDRAFWNSAVEAEMNPEKGIWNSVYHIESCREAGMEPCKKLEIRRDAKKLVGVTTLECGKALLKKMTSGGPILCLVTDPSKKTVEKVISFAKDGRDNYLAYHMEPVATEDGLTIGKESTSYLRKAEMEDLGGIGLWPHEASSGRSWYQAAKGTSVGTGAELSLVKAWLKKNPGFQAKNAE